MKKKLLHIRQQDFLKCDNESCDFVLKDKASDRTEESYINEPCPECGENLLTEDDFVRHRKVLGFIKLINKWFGWLGTYPDDERNEVVREINCHKKININKPQ